MVLRQDGVRTELWGWDWTESASSKCHFFLLINTLLKRTLVGAWIAIFQRAVAVSSLW